MLISEGLYYHLIPIDKRISHASASEYDPFSQYAERCYKYPKLLRSALLLDTYTMRSPAKIM